MQLEQITRNHPRTAQERQTTYFVVDDLENLSASVLYSGDSSNPIVSGNGIVIPYGDKLGFDLHDTFKVDRYGNLYDGHSTSNLKSGSKLRINTDPLKARKDSSFSDK